VAPTDAAALASVAREPALRDVLAQLLADVVADMDIGRAFSLTATTLAAGGGSGAGSIAAPALDSDGLGVADAAAAAGVPASAAALLRGISFEDLAARPADAAAASLVLPPPAALAIAAGAAAAGGGPRGGAAALASGLLDAGLPPLRPRDLDLASALPAARLLRASPDCRAFAARLVESTVLAIVRDFLLSPTALTAPPAAADPDALAAAALRAYGSDEDEDVDALARLESDGDLMGLAATYGGGGDRALRAAPVYVEGADAED